MSSESIIDLIVAVCGLIPTVVSVIMLIINIIKEKNWTLVQKIAMEAMTTVEKYAAEHPEMTSEDKLNMALEAVKAGLAVSGITLDTELLKKIIAYIEEMCTWNNEMIECNKG